MKVKHWNVAGFSFGSMQFTWACSQTKIQLPSEVDIILLDLWGWTKWGEGKKKAQGTRTHMHKESQEMKDKKGKSWQRWPWCNTVASYKRLYCNTSRILILILFLFVRQPLLGNVWKSRWSHRTRPSQVAAIYRALDPPPCISITLCAC